MSQAPSSGENSRASTRSVRDVVFVDGLRTPFGRAGEKGIYAGTRADDLIVKCLRELLRRNPSLPPERVDEVAIAATTQTGDQGLTLGRTAALLAGLPRTVPGFAIDRMCAGAMTAVTTTAGGIGFGAYDVVIAGGVEHMGNHPMVSGADPNPRFMSERLVDPAALNMGNTAENLHDRFPSITKDRTDAYAVASQAKFDAARRNGRIQPDLVPVATLKPGQGWTLNTVDEPPRPGTTTADLAALRTPFRPHGRVTAGNAAGLNDGATAAILASSEAAAELGLPVRMRMVSYAYAGVEPEVMGIGPVPATGKALKNAGLSINEIGLFEINEAFAVQVLSFLEHFGIADDDARVNRYGGAIAVGHPLASSGVRLMNQLARQFEEDHSVRYGITTMCVGLGMGATVIWENPHHADYSGALPGSSKAETVTAAETVSEGAA
ncbi:acetyl-CoA acyltransferase [Arthrobacter sp. SLBN-100]|uniref:thiolase family protein n=1 Tax=Arthrobacter sp. SLBN-100 TaxID=2768450 RepID=UPI0011518C07|nr:acetyl-CoA C-acyltransferase [Arthrobacter sp. SLBN-100]TQJ66185.1 acetyl-CoA acyltransferase [Arthrobacter sp. SLBN-100]